MLGQRVRQRVHVDATARRQAERVGYQFGERRSALQGGELHPPHAVGVAGPQRVCASARQRGLAHAGRAGQRDAVMAGQQRSKLLEFGVAAVDVSQVFGQVARHR